MEHAVAVRQVSREVAYNFAVRRECRGEVIAVRVIESERVQQCRRADLDAAIVQDFRAVMHQYAAHELDFAS